MYELLGIVIGSVFAISVWISQKKLEILLESTAKLSVALENFKGCFTMYGFQDHEEDINFRMKLFNEHGRPYISTVKECYFKTKVVYQEKGFRELNKFYESYQGTVDDFIKNINLLSELQKLDSSQDRDIVKKKRVYKKFFMGI